MAIALNHLTNGSSTLGPGTFNTAVFTPSTNSLVFLFAVAFYSAGPNVSPGNGNGLTWANIFDSNIYTINASNSVGLWRAMASSPSSGAISISTDATELVWDIFELTGVDTSGTNGSGAVVRGTVGFGSGPTTITADLSGGPSGASNAIVGFAGSHDATTTLGVGSGYTSIDGAHAVNNTWLTQWLNAVSQNACDFTLDSGSGRTFSIEVLAGSTPPPTTGAPSGLVAGAGF